MTSRGQIILGIDPGTIYLGYGLIEKQGNHLEYIDMGILNLKSVVDPLEKLGLIQAKVRQLIVDYAVDMVAVEAPFQGVNPQSMLKLGRAQGVVIATAVGLQKKVEEYAPLKVKQAVTGNGRASKEQLCKMVFTLLNMQDQDQPRHLDASDALGVAVCAALQKHIASVPGPCQNKTVKKKRNSWADFVNENPTRVSS